MIRFLAALFILFLPLPAGAGVLEFFFPSLRVAEPDPGLTLKAPFASDPKKVEGKVDLLEKEKQGPLDRPHRTAGEIAEWLSDVAAIAMTFENTSPDADLTAHRKNFDDNGYQMYTAFLAENGIKQVLDSNRFFIRSFSEELPLLLNEGAVDGSYRWLFEIPVMVTYMPREMKDYKQTTPVSQKMKLTVQVGRARTAPDDTMVVIQRWSGKVLETKK